MLLPGLLAPSAKELRSSPRNVALLQCYVDPAAAALPLGGRFNATRGRGTAVPTQPGGATPSYSLQSSWQSISQSTLQSIGNVSSTRQGYGDKDQEADATLISKPSLTDRPARLCFRANERLEEFAVASASTVRRLDGEEDTAGRANKYGINSTHEEEMEKEQEHFKHVCMEMDALMGKAPAEVVTLKVSTPIHAGLGANSRRIYRVPLPHKPMKVTVNVDPIRVGDPSPTLYGSLDSEPSGRSHQFVGEDGFIEYTHAYSTAQQDDSGNFIDRRKKVPQFRFLLVCLQAGKQDCQYQIAYKQEMITIILLRQELKDAGNSHKPVQLWQKRMQELKSKEGWVPPERPRHSEGSIVKKNRTCIATRLNKYLQVCNNAVDQVDHREEVKQRRVQVFEQAHTRLCKVSRNQEKQRKMEEAEALVEAQNRTKEWMRVLVVVSAIESKHNSLTSHVARTKAFQDQLKQGQVNFSEALLRRFMRRRRNKLYIRVIQLRIGLQVYCRCMALPVRFVASTALVSFFKTTQQGSEDGDLLAYVKKFVWKVRVVQNQWRALNRMREARVDAYETHWRRLEPDIVKKSKMSRPANLRGDVHISEEKRGIQAPSLVVRKELFQLVVKQQKEWVQAVRAWNQMRNDKDKEAQDFLASDDVKMQQPRSGAFMLSKHVIEDLVYKVHKAWRAGDLEEVLSFSVQDRIILAARSRQRTAFGISASEQALKHSEAERNERNSVAPKKRQTTGRSSRGFRTVQDEALETLEGTAAKPKQRGRQTFGKINTLERSLTQGLGKAI